MPTAGRPRRRGPQLLEEALKLQETKLGPDHPDTLKPINLATGLQCRRPPRRGHQALSRRRSKRSRGQARTRPPRHAQQPEQSRRGLLGQRPHRRGHRDVRGDARGGRPKLGPDHPDTLISRTISPWPTPAGRSAEAIELTSRCSSCMEPKLGPDHPDTLTSRNNLAVPTDAPAAPPRPSRCYEETLKLQEAKLGPTTPTPS